MSYTENNTIAIRRVTDADAAAMRRLAALDSADTPSLPALLAEVDGEPRAAVSITTGEAISDPFAPTADLLTLLRLRASILTEHETPTSLRRRLSIPIRRLA